MKSKSLSERLKFWRACRPDEWVMDEFIRDAEVLEVEVQRQKNNQDIIGMYQRKEQKTHIINGFVVPAPESEEPKMGDWYFNPDICYDEFYEEEKWSAHTDDLLMLKRGLVFLTREDAIANAKAMLGIDPYKEIEE